MKIKNISKNNLSFPLKKKTGQKIVVVIRPDEFVFSEDDSKKTENQQLIIYERKKLIQISYMDKPEEMEFYKSYSDISFETATEQLPDEEIIDVSFDTEEEIIPITEEEFMANMPNAEDLIAPQIMPITPEVKPELIPNEIELKENPISPTIEKLKEDMMNAVGVPLNSSLDNEPTMEFADGIRENMNTTDIPEGVTDSTEPKPKHAGGRPKGVKNKPTDKSKKKKDHRKNWKFLKK